MVCINTHRTNLKVTHFVEIPSLSCVMATAREDDSRRAKLFLVERNTNNVYWRKGINDSWISERREHIRNLLTESLIDSTIPHYTTKLN